MPGWLAERQRKAALNKAMNEATDDMDRHVFVFEYSSIKVPKGDPNWNTEVSSPESPMREKKELNPLMIADVGDRPAIKIN